MKANGYEWQLNGNEVTCDGLAVCELEWVGSLDKVGYVGNWRIVADDQHRFSSQLSAFYFVMDMSV